MHARDEFSLQLSYTLARREREREQERGKEEFTANDFSADQKRAASSTEDRWRAADVRELIPQLGVSHPKAAGSGSQDCNRHTW